ncbi:hypothetical protein MUA04_22515 [Enterobacteriaceae bacterium H11S18]|uniref:lipoprotein n=1 Tax=Dryocola clanedunensis TaxID=2925396 RepID=UPI0022F0F26F|nr:lipoprotein [Dryocola clanedunensis]MCT4706196.1 hypothetical protein [Dryocola clanedunensis]MCT4712944.1 hypothetical protein [Dryocola clanedunensis]
MKKIIAVALGALLLSGCTVRVADMTVGSTKNYNINAAKFVKGQRVTGEDKAPIVIFPLAIPSVKTAMDRAIEQDKCAVGLSDVVVYQLNHAFLFGTFGYRVEGTQIIDKSQKGCENHV